MTKVRSLSDSEITASTGARTRSPVSAQNGAGAHSTVYEVQLEGNWVEVSFEQYEQVRAIQDSCA